MKEKILVTRPSMPPLDDYIAMIGPLWESAWLTNMGKMHEEFQRQLEDYLVVPEVSLMVNGHMSLEMTLQVLQLEGEVITTPYTFASTTHAIVRNGLTPVFCDVNPDNYTIDVTKIEELITEKTSAIVPVHIYGQLCDVNAIYEIAKKHNLKVVYDACHAFGERIDHSMICGEMVETLPLRREDVGENTIGVGNFGDASIFSFHATKVFHTLEGGAATFSDHRIGERLYRLKNFGIMSEIDVDGVGANAKMNEFQAAMGLCNLKYIDAEIGKRKQRIDRYREQLEHVKGLQLLPVQKGVHSNYAYFPVVFHEDFSKSRDEVYQLLRQENIFTRKYFYPLTSAFRCYNGLYDPADTPVARYVSEHVLVLPLYADLSLDVIDQICHIILENN
ncbi:MAG: DegT/DnrJ/EryC1/StrS family aminotransferase [Lachnospiraceae bacterium]|nr:DegT/DnrJ/EryC1/StrS family aminotransferase [Lachnospiraceae bacterium]